MDFLYFPDDKSEYLPGIISVIAIVILSFLIVWLLMRASKKEVEHLEEQGYNVTADKESEGEKNKNKES
ncbi:MAG TPA: hypothetical protein VK947_10210 [Planococcus sp. (in: firmicutes)]|nr:hypothetical protein [Planococcus sp. (in: firmicutes)]